MAPQQFRGDIWGTSNVPEIQHGKFPVLTEQDSPVILRQTGQKMPVFLKYDHCQEYFPSVLSQSSAVFCFLFVLSAFISLVLPGSGKAGAAALG